MTDKIISHLPINFKTWRPLTKSRFKTALECPTKLFYYGKKDEYANLSEEDDFLQALAEGGYQVGELAKLYYPGGQDIKELGYKEPLTKTNELLKQDNTIIYEAAVAFKDFFIRVDILNKLSDTIELIEVKAKSFHPEEDDFLKRDGYLSSGWKPYLYDIAFQTWVAQQAFPNKKIKSYLFLCDRSKVATVDGLNQLFRVKKNAQGRKEVVLSNPVSDIELGDEILIKIPVDNYVNMILSGKDTDPLKADKEEQKEFISRANEYANYYSEDNKYPVSIGSKCRNCEYQSNRDKTLKSGYEECWKSVISDFDVNKPHIFDIWNYRKKQQCLDAGIYYIDDFYSDPQRFDALNQRQKLQVQKTSENDISEYFDAQLFNELESWQYPLHFIDFETSMVAIPFHKGKRPYEQTAFQFSCHTIYEDKTIKQKEWINVDRGVFPNYQFVDALKKVLENDNGTILRYSPYENTVLRQIQRQMVNEDESKYAELIEWIDTITEWRVQGSRTKEYGERNMVDMLKVLKDNYYHPLMRGSNSIKAVLPAIFATSNFIKERYSKPVGYGINLKDTVLYQLDSENKPQDPYKLLENQYADIDLTNDELILEDGKIQDGAAAMIAYAKLQFTDMTDIEKEALTKSLLQYCELDTLAMVMIYEHWKYN